MLGHVYLGDGDAESFGDLLHGPLLEHVEVKHLKLFGVDLLFDAGERRVQCSGVICDREFAATRCWTVCRTSAPVPSFRCGDLQAFWVLRP